MEASIKDSSPSMTEVSVWQPCSFSPSLSDEEDNDVQEASGENCMFLMVDENDGSSGGGSGGGSSSEENKESVKLQKYGCHPYFNSHMGGCDLRVLFSMSLGMSLSSHDVPPFSIVKGYHKEIKQDAGTLQLEVLCQYDAYGSCLNGKPPCPKKCIKFLNDYPVIIPEEITLQRNQIANYKKIQESINNSRKEEDERVIQ